MKLEELFSVRGKVALVTGGSRGLGEMIARGYVENGAKVYITARRADVCDALAKELSEFGECISIPADLSRMEEIDRLSIELRKREKKLDILVNNAGASWGARFEEFPEKRLGQSDGPQRQIRVLPDAAPARLAAGGSVRGQLVTCDQYRVDRRHSNDAPGGLFLCSLEGRCKPFDPYHGSYAASKAGVNNGEVPGTEAYRRQRHRAGLLSLENDCRDRGSRRA